jgi:hypothetical protein
MKVVDSFRSECRFEVSSRRDFDQECFIETMRFRCIDGQYNVLKHNDDARMATAATGVMHGENASIISEAFIKNLKSRYFN